MSFRRSLSLSLAFFSPFLGACAKPEIETYTVAKMAPGTGTKTSKGPSPKAQKGLSWKAPDGWIPKPTGGMRLASFAVPTKAGQEADFSIVVLPGPAGGRLSNVNRWRTQLGLSPIDNAGLENSSKTLALGKIQAKLLVVDLEGQKPPLRRTVAAILSRRGRTWFFKLTGPEQAVRLSKPDFIKLLRSLRIHESA